jgi:hypothetical protein
MSKRCPQQSIVKQLLGLPRLKYLKSAPIFCETSNAAVDLASAVRKRGRRQISELAEFSMISQQRESDKRYLPDKRTGQFAVTQQ